MTAPPIPSDLPIQMEMVRRDIAATRPGPAQDLLRRKLRRLTIAMQAEKWAASIELKPPT